jgi:hypothetical protein
MGRGNVAVDKFSIELEIIFGEKFLSTCGSEVLHLHGLVFFAHYAEMAGRFITQSLGVVSSTTMHRTCL